MNPSAHGATIKVSDYLISLLEALGVSHVFMISGGGIMHLVDSVGRAKKLTYSVNYHEQACAIAAEAYGRLAGLGVCIVTTGPGGTNTLTGLAGAWLDSIPILVIAGQVNTDATIEASGVPIRQFGYQELNMVDIVRPMTKYAVMVKDRYDIRYEIEKAIYLAKSGRPGPVWVEVPLNIQGAYLEDGLRLKGFDPNEEVSLYDMKKMKAQIPQIIAKLKAAKRPVIFAGNGIRLSGAEEDFMKLVDSLKIPVLASPAGYDLIPDTHPCYMGRPHTFAAQRAANFIVQNCDFLLGIGARFDFSVVSYNYKTFARGAYKVAVDIDEAELEKPSFRPDIAVHADAGDFVRAMHDALNANPVKFALDEWFNYARRMKNTYPAVLPEFWEEKEYVNSYCFVDRLSVHMEEKNILVISDGTALTCTHQAFRVKRGQRVILNNGCAAMGYGLSAAIGACFASKKKPLVCIDGDGSLQLNIHELQTMKHYNLPIKLFVYNNQGYLAIKGTQKTHMGERYVASTPESGVSVPDFLRVGEAYGIHSIRMKNNREIDEKIKEAFSYDGPVLCEIMMHPFQPLIPKLSAEKRPDGSLVAKPLEDLYPFLPREEFRRNMLIAPLEE